MNGQLTANNLTYSQGNLRLDLLRNQGNQTLQDQIQESKPLTIDPTKLVPVQPTTVFVPGTGFVNAYLEKRQPEVALNKFVKQEPLIPTDAPNLKNTPVFDPIKEYYMSFQSLNMTAELALFIFQDHCHFVLIMTCILALLLH